MTSKASRFNLRIANLGTEPLAISRSGQVAFGPLDGQSINIRMSCLRVLQLLVRLASYG